MKKLVLIALAGIALLPLSASAAKKTATIKIINQSKWEIHHLYLSPSSSKKWGPDQLGEDVLKKGESFTLTKIDCDDYDIRVVDEDGDECVIEEQSLCKDDSYWKITDKALLECENSDE
jgi:hypothetical protein